MASERRFEPKAGRPAQHRGSSSSLLSGLAKTVIEAALDAELVEHLGDTKYHHAGQTRKTNSRNGSRSKTVRTVVGPVQIDAPRDRWGTFEPMTVGKWQREVVGIDRLLMPLAAKGAPPQQVVDLLSQVYPAEAPEGTLQRIAATTRSRLAEWHDRRLDAHFPVLRMHVSALQTPHGQVAGFPFVAVVGVRQGEDGTARRELLSLHALPLGRGGEPWQHVVGDLRRRGVVGVRTVVGEGSGLLRSAVANVWPCATVTDRAPAGLLAS